MGLLRLLLALAVVVSHCGPSGAGLLCGGRFAVQTFFMLSGFYMCLVLTEKYPAGIPGTLRFWKARARRLLPTYWFALVLSLACLAIPSAYYFSPIFTTARFAHAFSISPAPLQAATAVANLTIFGTDSFLFLAPIDFGMSLPIDDLHYLLLVPQSWSLAVEALFYVAAPWLCRARTTTVIFVMGFSLSARVLLFATTDASGDPWTYRFFPFELALFSAGILSYRAYRHAVQHRRQLLLHPALSLLPILSFACFTFSSKTEICFWLAYAAIGLSLPSIFRHSSRTPWDKALADLAYPIYTLHHIVLAFLFPLLVNGAYAPVLPLVTCLSVIACAMLSLRLENQTITWLTQGRTRPA